ncbi:protein cueball isoform X2 [Harpegnathos saltator]|uniref:Protein cueball n=1 Tax=Harpegnathos saltator TaxID=610380 RepID=E2B682_HARSA|nr:protein cueball isoform X2 [Harpegnathos saltator]EFN88775.1 Low-density lipoprotein receptor-related protein 1 [Harpegnathos saltator]
MISNKTRRAPLPSCLLLLCTLVVPTYARSWDLAVVIGSEIDFFARNQTLTGQANIGEAVTLTGVTYDDTTRTMFLSAARNNVSIFSNDLTKKNFTSIPLLKKENGTHVIDIVFDASSRILFWVDALREIIAKMHVSMNGEPGEPVILHNLTNRNPRGIALDVCNSHIYWANSNKTNPSIERSNLDGSNRTIVIHENLYEPLAVTIDHAEQKLYWTDDDEGIHFKIERSNLDGSKRELLVHYKHQQPVYLAVDSDSIYWSDWIYSAVWTMPKNVKEGDYPTKFKSYFESKRDTNPAGIVTRDNVGKIDCAAILTAVKRKNVIKPVQRLTAETFNNLTTSTEESELTTESSIHCLNDGHLNKTAGTCRCKPGFIGTLCETSLCHNYCLRGKCTTNHRGLPECECPGIFSGARCERDVCDGYCLHDGECSVLDGRPHCSCKYSTGTRCEEAEDIGEICAIYCASDRAELLNINVTSCRCTDDVQTAARIVKLSDSVEYRKLLLIFLVLATIALLFFGGVTCYAGILRRKPRVKRRFVGVTPLTSRPQIPDNQCEITIENCCNMNICETPCFEPKLCTMVPRSNSSKKEEKNSLLDNMEGNSC